ncbi:MAG: hypothetical protein OSJ59_15710, partial [Lachnospiraceae bacterium]|nr:hypothetical protein [Lachnospiraceae bacterium]
FIAICAASQRRRNGDFYENRYKQFEKIGTHPCEDGAFLSLAIFYGGFGLRRRESMEALRGQSAAV